jgi:hypothetical protein
LDTVQHHFVVQNGDTLTGTLDANNHPVKISIANGATVTLDGVTINGTNNESYRWAGITCLGNVTLVLKDGTTNTVKGFYNEYPGVFVYDGYTLTIQGGASGTGKLIASSNGHGAGIGGGYNISCGNIDIQGGIIEATGGQYAAGIGGGYIRNCGTITITDGVTRVTATKGTDAPNSIGIGYRDNENTCGTVTIGGTVYWQNNAYVGDGANYLTQSTIVYPTSVAPTAAADATAEDIGKVIGADGNIYDNATAAANASTTAVAMIAYVGNATGHTTYNHGLALAMSDENAGLNWEAAKTACSGKNSSAPVINASWMLPSENQWNSMFSASGGSSALRSKFSIVGGTNIQQESYWSSSTGGETEYALAYNFGASSPSIAWTFFNRTSTNPRVRACLAF